MIPKCKQKDDTGQIDLELQNNVSACTADGVTYTPQIRRIGKVVKIRGIVTGIVASWTGIAKIPEEFQKTRPLLYPTTNYNDPTRVNVIYCGWEWLVFQQGSLSGTSGARTLTATERIVLDTMYLLD